jgi:hypothetical protein
MLDHSAAQAVFQRLIAGKLPGEGDIEQALAHAAGCEECAAQFELGLTTACEEIRDDLPAAAQAVRQGRDPAGEYPAVARHLEECDWCRIVLAELVSEPERQPAAMTEAPVEPVGLFERALSSALSDPDALVRERAAERMGTFEHLNAPALAALALAAREDPDESVRASALRAFDELDAQVSISERLIGAWAAAPATAGPFIESVLAHLAGEGVPVSGVAELLGTPVAGEESVAVTGQEGISGRLSEEARELKLALEGLPPKFEHAKLVVAIPKALEEPVPPVEWPGQEPGLVPAQEPVETGSLNVSLGRLVEDLPAEKRSLFRRMFLLHPEARRPKRD